METRVLSDVALHGALIMSKNESGFPSNPAIGTMIIKDECLYAYIRVGGMATWYPFSRATNSYVHTQGLASSSWTVNHQLGTLDTWYQVKGPDGNIVIVGKTDIDVDSFTLNFTSAIVGTCIVVAPDSIDVPQVTASVISVANDAVVINSSGVLINGSYALTSSNIATQIADAIATKDNSDEITEGVTNLYFTQSRARAAFSTGTGIAISASGSISVDSTVATSSSVTTEVSRASAAEATLTTNLNGEISRATGAESTLTTNLNAEISRASAAEVSLASAIAGKQPLDSDLTAIAALTGSPGYLHSNGSGTWTVNDSPVTPGAGVTLLPSTELGVDVYATGGLMTTVDGSTSDTTTSSQLSLTPTGVTSGWYLGVNVDNHGRVTAGDGQSFFGEGINLYTRTEVDSLLNGYVQLSVNPYSDVVSQLNSFGTATSNFVAFSLDATVYRSAKMIIQATNSAGNAFQTTELLLIHDGTTVSFSEINSISIGTSFVTFDAVINGTNNFIEVLITSTSGFSATATITALKV